jgi:hypothetical protein
MRTREPLGRGAGRLGRTEDSAHEPNSNKETLFFLKLFYKL